MEPSGQFATQVPDAGARIAGRYRVEAELARGGMGVVYRVVDETSGQTQALKRMVDPTRSPRLSAMFEREYRTLAALEHPRIIDVYAYGVEDGQPYYTMELLSGDDLRELSPLPYKEACRYLRDVASSLALLHARRLLHRDLSPRNVRAAGDGHCKLIDFGALATFGVSGEVVGTPPCIPPEALRGLPLDQRADLYSLGALAYWVLTRRHAYHARDVKELPQRWRQKPAPPSRVVSQRRRSSRGPGPGHIPEELDALVMALLSQDPQARPRSGAEVIERLNAIAGLDEEPLPDVATSYLTGARLVAREPELERLGGLVSEAVDGRGRCAAIVGQAGIGRTRVLDEVAIQGQLAGAVVLRVDAALGDGAYATTRELARQLIEAAPEVAGAAARADADRLGRVSDDVRAHLRLTLTPRGPAEAPGEVRKRTQAALRAWFASVARELPMVIAVDNFERADEASAALLTRLARDTADTHLLLLVSIDNRREPVAPAAVTSLLGAAEALRLRRLDREETLALARALLGAARGIKRFAQLLFERSQGNPGACIALTEHLIQRDVIRLVDGSWVIRDDIVAVQLPASLDAVSDAQLDQLGTDAIDLLRGLALKRGTLPLELCTHVAEGLGIEDAFVPLEELVHRGVLLGSPEGYRFAQDSLRDAASRRLQEREREQLHGSMGRFLIERAGERVNLRLEAGFHLLHGGERGRGADILADAGLELIYDSDEMPAACGPLEAALQVYREQGRSTHELARLLSPLAVAGYSTDLALANRYGDEAVAVQQRDLGLSIAARLRPLLGRNISTLLGLGIGATRYMLRYGARGVSAFVDAVTRYTLSCTALAGAGTICLDGERARHFAKGIEPLKALGKLHIASVTHDFVLRLSMLVEDRCSESYAGLLRIAEDFESGRVKGIQPGTAEMVLGGAYYALGALASFKDGASALRHAEQLEGVGVRLYDMVAEQVRANFHANRGELALAETHRQGVELHAIDSGSAWQAEVWNASASINSCIVTQDMLGLKRALEELNGIEARVPSLALYTQLALGTYQYQRGEFEKAAETLRAVHAERPPKSFIGWASSVATRAAAHNAMGEPERALELCDGALAKLTEADLEFTAFTTRLHAQRAWALVNLGRTDEAVRTLEGQLGKAPSNPVTCGILHEYRARVAHRMGDGAAFLDHADRMARHYRSTDNPALIAVCAHFENEHEVQLEAELPGEDEAAHLSVLHTYFLDLPNPEARAERALELLLSETGARSGFLYAIQEGDIRLLAPRHGDEPPTQLEPWLRSELEEEEEVTAITEGLHDITESAETVGRRLCLLQLPEDGDRIIGAAVLDARGTAYTPPGRELLDAIARGVWDPSQATVAVE